MSPGQLPGPALEGDTAGPDGARWALLDYRLGQIEAAVGRLAAPEAQALQHQYLDSRVALLEQAQAEDRRNRRQLLAGVMVALTVPVLSYVLQLAGALPTPG